ncbi:Outer membrane protein OmpA [Ekhidna lutea]|uniref:Outer membrane protein OmpA n=1 Tax=Ekhidna lutea TaxID=447679 RepID=A0A239J1P2_EKHLU|nr:OmpA family protein [Ekhidna lutea]SNS99729.1 Outer membrane protein OmpA [Ekhidna lutea]
MPTFYKTIRLPIVFLLILFGFNTTLSQDLNNVNTGAVVKNAKVSFDGTKMVFLANYYGSFWPYMSTYNADSAMWGEPEKIFENDVIAGFEIRDPHLSFDNTKLYFAARTSEKPDFDIFYSELQNGIWSKPTSLDIGINSPEDELGPALSADEKKVLFTRPLPPEAKADEFCGQLFYSELTEAGSWSEPELLPPAYNTGCICSPYYARDNKTFFYSSFEDVEDGEGKRVARKQFSVFWARIDGLFRYNPKPILSIIADEDIVSPSLDRDSTLYYNYGEYAKGQDRISSRVLSRDLSSLYQPAKMSLVSGRVTDENGGPLEAAIQVINPYTTKVFQEAVSDEQGNYQVFVPVGEQFSLLAYKDQYSAQSKLIEPTEQYITNNFELFPSVDVTFNVFDDEFFFPIESGISLYDSEFNFIETIEITRGEQTVLSLGKELNIIFNSENYFPDTLNLPFDEEVIFDFFDFDIELTRKLKDVALSFADESGNNLGLEITVYNVTRNEKTKRQVKDGKITLQLRDGEVYEISTSAEGYSYYSAEVDLSEEQELKEMNATLQSVENISLVLDNITFEYNSYELNAGSYDELGKLVNYLQENEQYKVEISAHTDNVGADAYNLQLSNLRANSVLQYLQDNAINKDRLVAVGYGESQPRYPNDTEENKAKNRRVEFKILASE